jgi:RNA polymerase sigma-70 factor, ECF subfamily
MSGGRLTAGRETDQQLVERAQRGDKRAFELLVVKYQHKLARVVARFVRNSAELEEVTQEAFIKAYRSLPSFRGESAFYTWLYRIGVNCAKNYLVARKRQLPVLSDVDDSNMDASELAADLSTPETELENRQIIESVNRTLQSLPAEIATAITLREIEGLSYDEIAHIMNCPVGTVRSRIFRGREAIAAQLQPLLASRNGKRW